MESQNENQVSGKRRFADFQNKYRRSSNFGYGSKRDRFAIAGDGELSTNKGEEDSRDIDIDDLLNSNL